MIKEKIYDYFKKENEVKVNDKITFAPSYFTDCKRKIYYKKTGQEISNPISAASYFKMEMGSSIHDTIQKIITKLPDVKLLECEDLKSIVWESLDWTYRVDGIIEIAGKKYILEIKTVYADGFRSIEETPKPEHILQAYMYMQFEKIDDCIILYIGRDNGFMIEYNFNILDFGYEFLKNVSDKIAELKILKSDITNKHLPERDFKIVLKNINNILSEKFQKDNVQYKTDWVCNYCLYKNKCWENELEKIKDYKFYINGEFIGG